MNSECTGGLGSVKRIYLLKPSDFKTDENGGLVLKRKYGKYDRKYAVVDIDDFGNFTPDEGLTFVVK